MNANRIRIGHVEIGDGLPCFLAAEIGLNHNGSMRLAHQHIDAAALAGASMVKFQKRSPAHLATAAFLDAPFPKCPLFGSTQRAVRERLELSMAQLRELQAHAHELGLMFSVSVFDIPSLEAVLALELPVIKIASHSLTHGPLLQAVAQTGIPVALSMGAASWEERDRAFEILKDSPLLILHCVSAYPCPDALVKLDTITALRQRYDRVVGYSGHEAGVEISVGAAVLGAALIERHFTLSRSMVGLDHGMSIEPEQFAEMVRRIRRIEQARGVVSGVAEAELPSRNRYHVAVCASRPIARGERLTAADLACKQPLGQPGKSFTGLELEAVVGMRAKEDLAADRPIPRSAVER